ncbi:MAG: hypothetical protein DRI61_02860 [Chloroflexi bacterium]|nr:MAG: hypothetical protein DRI61_02860 [Chloroflexota bacterium]
MLSDGFGDGEGAMIHVSCAWGEVCYDPEECFIAIESGGPHLTDIVITAMIVEYNGFCCSDTYFGRTPDFTLYPIFKHLGNPHRDPEIPDQWRWDDPFLEIVSAGGNSASE